MQKLLCGSYDVIKEIVNPYLEANWKVVPQTLVLERNDNGFLQFVVVVERH